MRKGVFIPDITVEMFKNATLEAVEEFMCSDQMEDIEIPERPHGVWKEVCDFDGNHYKWECSVCGRLEEFEEDFCNCGADMRKEGEQE